MVFREQEEEKEGNSHRLTTRSQEPGSTFCDGGEGEYEQELDLGDSCLHHPDPRLVALGHRLLLPPSCSPLPFLPNTTLARPPSSYFLHRCKLGVAEGAEIPRAKALPLEYNLDYLRGVSFHKGCYIGQELTARTHHTGVVRKRILPLGLEQELEQEVGPEQELGLLSEQGKAVGKLRVVQGKQGLGMVRLKEGLGAQEVRVEGVRVTVSKPSWWPNEKEESKANV